MREQHGYPNIDVYITIIHRCHTGESTTANYHIKTGTFDAQGNAGANRQDSLSSGKIESTFKNNLKRTNKKEMENGYLF